MKEIINSLALGKYIRKLVVTRALIEVLIEALIRVLTK